MSLDTTFFISDTHFDHANRLKYDNCPFKCVNEHDEVQIQKWNKRVRPNDTVYHIGDFARTLEKAETISRRLNGKIYLIFGNHDDFIIKKMKKGFAPIGKFEDWMYVKYLRMNKERFYLHHYSCRTWRNSNHGSYHIHGHSHGALPILGRSMDVGSNCINYTPISAEEVIHKLKDQPFIDHHQREDDE